MRIRLWRPSDDRRALKPPGVCHRAHTSTLAMAIKPRQMTFEILGAVWFPASARKPVPGRQSAPGGMVGNISLWRREWKWPSHFYDCVTNDQRPAQKCEGRMSRTSEDHEVWGCLQSAEVLRRAKGALLRMTI